MKRSIGILAAVGGLFAACLAAAPAVPAGEPVGAASRVSAVTVYPDRAVVTRTLEVELPAGRSVVAVDGLLPGLDERTLKCLPAAGARGLAVADLSSEVYRREAPGRADLAAMEEQRARLEAEIRTVEDGIVAIQERTRVLAEYRELTTRAMKQGLAAVEPKVDDWLKASEFISGEALEATKAVRHEEKKKYDLGESLRELNARIAAVRVPDGPLVRRAQLTLDCAGPGLRKLELSYLVREGVRWGPQYDLRLDRKAGQVELARFGAATQATGEDWEDVPVTFSTRSPARGLRPPEVEPVMLGALDRPTRTSTLASVEVTEDARLTTSNDDKAADGTAKPSSPEMTEASGGAPPAVAGAPAAAPSAGRGVPELVSGGEVVEFVSTGRITVRSDGKPALVPLGAWKTRCDWHLECVPKLLNSVYIRGAIANPSGGPLLPGPGECFVDGSYIGKVQVPPVPTGAPIELSFGAVEGLSVTREAQPLEGRRGRGYRYAYLIEVANAGAEPAKITVLEAIPVSTVKTVSVELGKDTTPCEELDGGRLRWRLDIPPGGRSQVRLAFRVDISREYRY
jgi:uncharacterized protein (TIGR02231 family)